jgi:hypothetical protein
MSVAIDCAVGQASSMRRWGIAALVTASTVLMLAACTSGPPSVADDTYRGLPEATSDSGDPTALSFSAQGAWVKQNQTFALTTWGSSSCPLIPTSIESEADDAVTIHFERSPQTTCTADMAAITHEFTVPAGSDSTPLTVTLTYDDWDPEALVLE